MLRKLRVPYVSVNEARRALLPGKDCVSMLGENGQSSTRSLKNFDFVLYGPGTNLLIDVKGRRLAPAARAPLASTRPDSPIRPTSRVPHLHPTTRTNPKPPRLESWVNRDDVQSMLAWNTLFGPDFEAAFVFFYASSHPPMGDLFDETFLFEGRWYAPRVIAVSDFARSMRTRSKRWGTVHLDREAFEATSGPLLSPGGSVRCLDASCPSAPWIERLSDTGDLLETLPVSGGRVELSSA